MKVVTEQNLLWCKKTLILNKGERAALARAVKIAERIREIINDGQSYWDTEAAHVEHGGDSLLEGEIVLEFVG